VEKTEPLRKLLVAKVEGSDIQELSHLGGPQLRDRLLYLDPLNVEWVKQVNQVIIARIHFFCLPPTFRLSPCCHTLSHRASHDYLPLEGLCSVLQNGRPQSCGI